MHQDILRESSVYQEIVEEVREEERLRRIQEHRTILMRLIELHFPELEALAKQQSDGITNPEVLPPVNFKLLAAQTVEEAKRILLSIDKGETKH
jgi:predicted transposase YdaD